VESKRKSLIYIERKRIPVPIDLVTAGSEALREKAAAIEYFRAIRAGKKPPVLKGKNGKPLKKQSFEFSAYNSDAIKDALKDLFNGKCAYCESEILSITVGDIEHYRPKGEIVDPETKKKITPGYYWLACDWDNLLLSCNNCNRKTTQEITDKEGEEEVMGKGNQFPLAEGGIRCLNDDEDVQVVEKESRLLLNPCIDDPEEHLQYLENGAVQAKQVNGKASLKGETSIKVFALYRKPLADKRQELFKAIQLHITELMEIRDDITDPRFKNDAARQATLDQRLQRKLAVLKEYQDEKKVFSAIAKQIITPFLKENNLI
jgi:uncharacterized protein (TIGR02646 family)